MVLLQSRLTEQGLRLLDVGGAGDCFFRAVSHQLYGETNYQYSLLSTFIAEYIHTYIFYVVPYIIRITKLIGEIKQTFIGRSHLQ